MSDFRDTSESWLLCICGIVLSAIPIAFASFILFGNLDGQFRRGGEWGSLFLLIPLIALGSHVFFERSTSKKICFYYGFGSSVIASCMIQFPTYIRGVYGKELYAGELILLWIGSAMACVVLSRLLYGRSARPTPNFPQCSLCGYNLTGNVSGICPECGITAHGINARFNPPLSADSTLPENSI